MSDSMIERVAIALVRAHVGGDASTWPMASERARDTYRGLARAAIEAMREPTEAMLDAGHMAMPVERKYWQENRILHAEMLPRHECVSPASPWSAMIAAALKEKP